MNKYLDNRKSRATSRSVTRLIELGYETQKTHPRWIKYLDKPDRSSSKTSMRNSAVTLYTDNKKKILRFDCPSAWLLSRKGTKTIERVTMPGSWRKLPESWRVNMKHAPADSSLPMGHHDFILNKVQVGSPSNHLIHRDILRLQLSQKQGTVSTKTRSEVRGGGKKPWRQKGTGRARAGSSRSPLWKGGGVIFGPKPKTVTLKVNKKERRLALRTLFYNKRESLEIIQGIEVSFYTGQYKKTKDFISFLGNKKNEKILFVIAARSPQLEKIVRNFKNIELTTATSLNTLSLLKAKKIVITEFAALEMQTTMDMSILNSHRNMGLTREMIDRIHYNMNAKKLPRNSIREDELAFSEEMNKLDREKERKKRLEDKKTGG